VEDSRARAVEERWVSVLAHVWNTVQWRRIRGRRHLDVFEHRLEWAKHEPDVPSVLQRLADSLSVQGLQVPVEDVEFLRAHEELALDVLRRWTKLLALKASVKARELRGRGFTPQQPAPAEERAAAVEEKTQEEGRPEAEGEAGGGVESA